MSDFDDEPPPLIEHDEDNIDENDVSFFLMISNQNLVKLKYAPQFHENFLICILHLQKYKCISLRPYSAGHL